MFRYRSVSIVFILLMLVAYVFTQPVFRPSILKRLEYIAYDLRMQFSTSPEVNDPRVVVVDIDDDSMKRVERWPWSRDKFAQLIANLKLDYQVAEVGLDVMFVDQVCNGQANDQRLIDIFHQYPPVMALSLQTELKEGEPQSRSGEPGKGVDLQGIGGISPEHAWWGQALGYVGNLADFLGSESAVGHISPNRDLDGKVRRISPIFQWDGQFYDTLSMTVARQYFGASSLYWDNSLDNWLDSPKLRLGAPDSLMYMPVSIYGDVLIPYSAGNRFSAYRRVSAADILEKKYPLDALADKFVLIGTSATGQADTVATPLTTALPGVEVHAALLSALLGGILDQQQQFKIQPANEKWLQLGALVLLTALLWLAGRSGVWGMLVAAPLLLMIWSGFNYLLWSKFNLAIGFLPPALLILAVMTYSIVADLLEINARHQHVRKMFSYYLPAVVVQRLANDRTGTDWLKAERRDMTVLFADVYGFTSMAESLDPEAVADITYQLFSSLTEVIHRHGGTVDKYMGDAVMAFWGAPLPDQHHALNTVKAADAMQKAVRQLNETVFVEKKISIRLGVGINSGTMVVGNLGSSLRHTYTVMGSVVNTASAIQQLTRRYQRDILLGEETASRLPDSMSIDLGFTEIKKLTHKIKIFALNSSGME
ncbi:adenylate/guanylate cyclase domain-containing protein [Candidatus Thiothrix sp. Deng01]|uniref:Adenylate/guanylate cyclase domain-containing protein n=1 Tax=Candidatus Thiothrix phosphatis TaxID=3112415 RepID=A0ABU6D054_9GAMM|nr:adenylate/guanylate cyclase domain-containing protein [Candidatus Thiothrix sp. Deng01]MEB4592466.1 adenylate/guanylate cyclase domain-containing protein [Candidatus Thiothrix sp. Deng01]